MSDKVKFLITSIRMANISSMYGSKKTMPDTIVLIALNKLLTAYEMKRGGEINELFYTQEYLDAVNSWRKNLGITYEELLEIYRNRDVAGLKRVLFGGLSDSTIEIFFDKAILGIREDGVQVQAACNGTRTIKFTETFVGKPDIKNVSNIKLKLGISGIESSITGYDCGTIYCIWAGIKNLKLNNCVGIFMLDCMESITLVNKNFGTLYIDAGTITNVDTEINNLVHMRLVVLRDSKLRAHNIFFSCISHLKGSTLKINNASNLLMEDIIYSEIEINNGFNIVIGDTIAKSRLRFNCDFNRELLDISNLRACYDVNFMFMRNIDGRALVELIWQLEGIKSVNKTRFKIIVNKQVYCELKNELDNDIMRHIIDAGEISNKHVKVGVLD